MALFQMKWLRALVRRNTNPIEYRHALAWKDRLSIAYMLVAWNAFGVVCYMVYSGRNDWAKFHGLKSDEEGRMTSSQQWARTLKIEKAKVIQIKGFQKVNEFEIGGDEDAHQPEAAAQ